MRERKMSFTMFWGTYILYAVTLFAVLLAFEFGMVKDFLAGGQAEALNKNLAGVKRDLANRVAGKKPNPVAKSERIKLQNIALDKEFVGKLQEGGYTLFIRHTDRDSFGNETVLDRMALTDKVQLPPPFTAGICLTDAGKAEAVALGAAFKELNIPVGKIYATPVCRATQTAEFAFGRVDVITGGFAWSALLADNQEREKIRKIGNEYLKTPPQKGKNKVITAHQPTLPALGHNISGIGEGETLVIKHGGDDGKDIEFVGKIPLLTFVKKIPVELD